MKFKKKPVVIEAWHVSEMLACAESNWKALPIPVAEAYERGEIVFCPKCLSVKTLEGVMDAYYTDMLIQGVKGELYPCKIDMFEATYERMESHSASAVLTPCCHHGTDMNTKCKKCEGEIA